MSVDSAARVAATAAVAVLALAGTGAARTAAPSASPTLVVAAAADNYFSNPKFATVGRYPTNADVAEPLVRMTAGYGVAPALATRWKFVPPNTWRFFLRRGVEFQNGTRFDAEAVKYSFDLMIAAGATRFMGLDQPSTVKVVDRYTVDFTPSFPNRRLVEQLVHPSRSIIAPGSSPESPIGTGPFRIVSYDRNRQLVVARWNGYWGKKAKLSRITFQFIPDSNARVLALESGAVQVASDVPRESTRDVARRGYRIERSHVGSYEAIYFALRSGSGFTLASNRAVRPAVGYAIDRRVIVRNVWQGNARVIETMVPPAILGPYARLVKGYRYDPARARKLLAADGWRVGADGIRTRGGTRLQLTMVVGFPSADIHGTMPEAVQAMLRAVGIDLKIVRAPDAAAYTQMLKAGQGDIFAEVGSQNDANPCFLPDLLFYFKNAGHTDYGYRFGPGGQFDRLIDQRCRTAVTHAQAERGSAQAMHVLIDRDHIVVPIAGVYRIYAIARQVRGFRPNPSQTNQDWTGVSLSR